MSLIRESPTITPVALWSLANQTEQGSYVLPTIQREFVWSERHILKFMQSLKWRYPLGMITLWSPKSTHIVDKLPFIDNIIPFPNALFVLDGQQRLTTMLLVKNDFKIRRDGIDIERKKVFYDPFLDDFYLRTHNILDDEEISVSDIANQSQEYMKWILDLQERKKIKEKERLEDFARAIRENQVGMCVIGPNYSYEDVASIFLTINSAGVKIGAIDMFFSLLASKFKKKFKDDILRFHKRTSKKTNISLRTPIRCLAAAMELKQVSFTASRMKKSIDKLSEDSELTKSRWEKTKDAIQEAFSLLSDRGLDNLRLLPAEAVLTPYCYYFYYHGKRISKEDSDRLFFWLLMASYKGRYSQSVNGRLDQDLKYINEGRKARNLVEALRKQVEGFRIPESDFDGPYTKRLTLLLYCTLRNHNALDWFGGGVIKASDIHVHHIFPRKYLRDNGIDFRDHIDDICNITLISSQANLDISDKSPSSYFLSEGIGKRKLDEHLVPLEEDLWEADRYFEFLEERQKLLYKSTRRYLRTIEHKT